MSKSYIKKQKESGFKIEDNVLIKRSAMQNEEGWNTCWVPEMDEYIGKTGKIISIEKDLGIVISFADGNEHYYFPYYVLEGNSYKSNNITTINVNKPKESKMDDDQSSIKITCNNSESAKKLVNILMKRDYDFSYEPIGLIDTQYVISINELTFDDLELLLEGSH